MTPQHACRESSLRSAIWDLPEVDIIALLHRPQYMAALFYFTLIYSRLRSLSRRERDDGLAGAREVELKEE